VQVEHCHWTQQKPEEITRKCVELAKAGDVTAIRLCLERLCPVRKARVKFPMPMPETLADLPQTVAAIVKAVADGTLAPEEGAAAASVVEAWRRAVDLAEIEARLRQVETAIERSRAATGEG
jgi:hypothetical protein